MRSLFKSRLPVVVFTMWALILFSTASGASEAALASDLKRLLLTEQYQQLNSRLRPLARQGDAAAQYQLAINFQKGLGLTLDRDHALYWFELAAQQQHAKAQFSAALVLLDRKNEQQRGLFYLTEAAGNGHAMAGKRLKALQAGHQVPKEQLNERLGYAAKHGDMEQLKHALKLGANLNNKNSDGLSALHLAIESDHRRIVLRLLASGASAKAVDKKGNTALHYAVRSGNRDILVPLLKKATLNQRNQAGDTALSLAVWLGYNDAAALLLKQGANANSVNREGLSLADVASAKNRPRLLALLKAHGARHTEASKTNNLKQRLAAFEQQLQQPAYQKWDKLMLAAWSADLEMVRWMLAQNGKWRLAEALLLALRQQQDDVAALLGQSLIDRRAGMQQRPEFLRQAIFADALVSFRILYQSSERNIASQLLWESINASASAITGYLLAQGADPDTIGPDGIRCLHQAANLGNTKIIKALLAKQVLVDQLDPDRRTALSYAADGGHLPAARLLLRSGAKINHQDLLGFTALIRAVRNDHFEVAKYLVDFGADIELSTANGNHALLVAAEKARPSIVKILLKGDSDVTRRNSNSLTALMVAVTRGNIDVVENLLVAEADPSRRSRAGKSVIEMTSDPQITQLLQAYD